MSSAPYLQAGKAHNYLIQSCCLIQRAVGMTTQVKPWTEAGTSSDPKMSSYDLGLLADQVTEPGIKTGFHFLS